MKRNAPMTQGFIDKVADFLWENMERDPENADRVRTGWGTKTKQGLAACVLRIVEEEQGGAIR